MIVLPELRHIWLQNLSSVNAVSRLLWYFNNVAYEAHSTVNTTMFIMQGVRQQKNTSLALKQDSHGLWPAWSAGYMLKEKKNGDITEIKQLLYIEPQRKRPSNKTGGKMHWNTASEHVASRKNQRKQTKGAVAANDGPPGQRCEAEGNLPGCVVSWYC